MARIPRVIRTGLLLLLLAGAVAFAISYPRVRHMALPGAGYVAHQLCSCVHVAGRDLDACRADLIAAVASVRSEPIERGGRPGVRAWVPIYAERVALYRPEIGCSLE